MKVQHLLEALTKQDDFWVKDTYPSLKEKDWTGRYKYQSKHTHYASSEEVVTDHEDLKYQSRIVLSNDPPIKIQGLDQAAVKDAYERAKARFIEIRKAHPTQLRFESFDEAKKYMKTMEYPGWTLNIQWARLDWEEKNRWGNKPEDKEYVYKYSSGMDWKDARKVKTLDLKPQEYKPPVSDSEYKIEDLGNGQVKISPPEKSGPKFSAFLSFVLNVPKKWKPVSSTGKSMVDYSAVYRSRPQSIFVKATVDEVKASLAKSVKRTLSYDKKEHDNKQTALDTRKADNKFRAEQQKARKAELYAKYGKEIVERVKVRPMSLEGDDGYQWALFLDGRRYKSGMTQYQADGEQRMMWNWLLKWEKMTPKERLDHQKSVQGLEAYFAYEAMEKSLKYELPKYLDAIKKNAKKYIDTKTAAKDAIEMSKVSDEQAKKIFKDLMNKLQDKSDD